MLSNVTAALDGEGEGDGAGADRASGDQPASMALPPPDAAAISSARRQALAGPRNVRSAGLSGGAGLHHMRGGYSGNQYPYPAQFPASMHPGAGQGFGLDGIGLGAGGFPTGPLPGVGDPSMGVGDPSVPP